jgi:GNAT superfamily N-acetyltransferase
MFGQFAQATDEQLGALAIRAQGCGEIFLLEAISKAGVEVVGFLAMVALEHAIDGRRYGDELAWWVAPDHRGARAGGFLLATAESWARENGLSMVKMVAPADSTIGEFYVRHGYAAVETSYQKVLS